MCKYIRYIHSVSTYTVHNQHIRTCTQTAPHPFHSTHTSSLPAFFSKLALRRSPTYLSKVAISPNGHCHLFVLALRIIYYCPELLHQVLINERTRRPVPDNTFRYAHRNLQKRDNSKESEKEKKRNRNMQHTHISVWIVQYSTYITYCKFTIPVVDKLPVHWSPASSTPDWNERTIWLGSRTWTIA